MQPIFKTEGDAIKWLTMNIAICIKPKRKAKTKIVYAFSSFHAQDEVVKHLAKDLFEYQKEQLQKKDIIKTAKIQNEILNEEIDKAADEYFEKTVDDKAYQGFIDGAKWYRKKVNKPKQ